MEDIHASSIISPYSIEHLFSLPQEASLQMLTVNVKEWWWWWAGFL